MKLTGGRLFVLTAGMLTECTPAHDLAMRMIGDERQAIFFVGYADPDTPGGRLKAAKPGETFVFSAAGRGSDAALRDGRVRLDSTCQPGGAAGFCGERFSADGAAGPRRAGLAPVV